MPEEDAYSKLKKILGYASYFLGASFILGFFIWNIYLYGLGFKEDNIIQTRFIFTGISFLVITFLIYYIIFLICSLINYLVKKYTTSNIGDALRKNIKKLSIHLKILLTLLVLFVLVIYLFLFVANIFTRVPMVLGGGRPRSLAILAETDALDYLKNFGVTIDTGKTQTANICIVYENDKYAIIAREDRILQIKTDGFKGYSSLPGTSVSNSRDCSKAVRGWILKTYVLEISTKSQLDDFMLYEQRIITSGCQFDRDPDACLKKFEDKQKSFEAPVGE